MKSEQKDEREMHKTNCSDCGNECEVPFKPDEVRPVYCKDCLQKHRTSRKQTSTNKTEIKSPEPVAEPTVAEPTVEKQYSSLLIKHQYLQADFANSHKLFSKQLEDKSKSVKNEFIEVLIDIYEDLERIDDTDSSLNGIKPVIKKIKSIFDKQSVKKISAEGNPFDSNLHDAIDYTENSETLDNIIISEIKSGWKIHDKVLRPSKVNVSKNKVSNDGVNVNE